MLDNYLSLVLPFLKDAGGALLIVLQVVTQWTSMIPLWAALTGCAVLAGITITVMTTVRANRLDAERRMQARHARAVRRKRSRTPERHVFPAQGRARVPARPVLSPAARARELVRRGVALPDVCRQTRLSFDAVNLLARAARDAEGRKVRPDPAPLAGSPGPVHAPGLASSAA